VVQGAHILFGFSVSPLGLAISESEELDEDVAAASSVASVVSLVFSFFSLAFSLDFNKGSIGYISLVHGCVVSHSPSSTK
jgi:hypothetical protein